MERIKQGMAGYKIPGYMEEILTGNYCPYFMRMSMVRENEVYSFNYRPDKYRKLNKSVLNTYEKLVLIRSVITLTENAREYMISPDRYLIEPELIYINEGRVSADSIRMMFYPDVKKLALRYKLIQFAERLKDPNRKEERELFEQLRAAGEGGDINRVKLFLDKNIQRMENRGAA
ncbi:MAG: hypothetical protein IJH95_07045 [Mogibacterium sp.]|nr:hypothetical protein [Mogibacterium sp.]